MLKITLENHEEIGSFLQRGDLAGLLAKIGAQIEFAQEELGKTDGTITDKKGQLIGHWITDNR